MKSAAISPGTILIDDQPLTAVNAEVEVALFPMTRAKAAELLGFSEDNRETPNQHFRRWLDKEMPLASVEDFIEFYLRVKASKKPLPGLSYAKFDRLKDQARSDLEYQGIDQPTHRQILDALEPSLNKLGISQLGALEILCLDFNP
jgi:hypothetical protein